MIGKPEVIRVSIQMADRSFSFRNYAGPEPGLPVNPARSEIAYGLYVMPAFYQVINYTGGNYQVAGGMRVSQGVKGGIKADTHNRCLI